MNTSPASTAGPRIEAATRSDPDDSENEDVLWFGKVVGEAGALASHSVSGVRANGEGNGTEKKEAKEGEESRHDHLLGGRVCLATWRSAARRTEHRAVTATSRVCQSRLDGAAAGSVATPCQAARTVPA